ncbi:MAG TPA: hypothetical protein VMD91_01850 [Candidatus Sulfotelmatobacter sp.]|nr:hypothetical protein [Candidatus Sulfotelmatobacter sp.]
MRTFVLTLGVLAAGTAPAGAQPSQGCSHDTFTIGGQRVGVSVCAPTAPDDGTVPVAETVSGATSIARTTTIQVLAGAKVSRTVDDVALGPLGLSSTLHLTLAYADGKVWVEHALLLPGAVPLK